MGYFLQTGRPREKAKALLAVFDGLYLTGPIKFADIPENHALVAVVHNDHFEAAGVMYCQEEIDRATSHISNGDGRLFEWLLLKGRDRVYEAANIKKELIGK